MYAMFGEFYHFKRHDETYKGEITSVRYKGGVYQAGSTCIERLQKCHVNIPDDFFHPFRITYDFEHYFNKIDRKKANISNT